MIEEELRNVGGMNEYAIFAKASILRLEGQIHDALALFHAATTINPSVENITQVARCLYLLGKHESAIQALDQALDQAIMQDCGIDTQGSQEERDKNCINF